MLYQHRLIRPTVENGDYIVYDLPPGTIVVRDHNTSTGLHCLVPVTAPAVAGPHPVTIDDDGTVSGYIAVKDRRPHSRACGIRPHEHGSACARDCPTCHPGFGAPVSAR